MENASGTQLNAGQTGLMDCYDGLVRVLTELRADLAPYEERNALKALAALWQVANGLDRDPGQLYDVGA
ncbi:MAG: hypothetical protein M3345_04980 [Actinomycetota bacterium]|nr:hypothetical protein [Actinomycetota bacterium]